MGAAGLICSTLSQNVSFMGKTWWVSMLASRVLLVLLAGFTLYDDDQGRFICNTLQPGCSNVCFDAFAPVSVYHLWLLHCVLLGLPHALFAAYVAHEVLSRPGSVSPRTSAPSSRGPAPRFHCTYSLTVVLRIVLEAGFGAGQFLGFGSSVPRSFLCYEAPCVSGVECYVSKPTEKTLMLHFMLGVSSLSVLVSLLDLVSSVKAMGGRRRKRATLVEETSKEERSSVFITTGSAEDGGRSTRRTRPSGSSADAEKDAELPDPKGSGGVAQMDECACSPVATTTPVSAHLRGAPPHPRGPTPRAVTDAGLPDPGAEASGQQPESQDKRAWV